VLGLDVPPRRGDCVVDLDGRFVLPGLINAHDHLELNHYGALKGRDRYENASQWIDDMRVRLRDDACVRGRRSHPLGDRLFIGGLKNLLSGATTVAHHNPLYRGISRHVPVRVVRRFRWAHSLAMQDRPVGDGGERGGDVVRTCLGTPAPTPFVVHAGEGIDDRARGELDALERAGCFKRNTVLVHGVACSEPRWKTMIDAGTSLVWCPASNAFLFGRTIPAGRFLRAHLVAGERLCLGSDSRLTGAADLLQEMRAAVAHDGIAPADVLTMVTTAAARVLRVDGGRLVERGPADLIVTSRRGASAAEAIVESSRADLDLVVIAGQPLVAAPDFAAIFDARKGVAAALRVDGAARLAAASVVRRVRLSPLTEAGVEWA
jgi:hypothetical protein